MRKQASEFACARAKTHIQHSLVIVANFDLKVGKARACHELDNSGLSYVIFSLHCRARKIFRRIGNLRDERGGVAGAVAVGRGLIGGGRGGWCGMRAL